MEIVQINKANIKLIAAFIEANRYSCSELATNFKGTILRQEINKNWVKFIIDNDSAIKSIVIDCQNSKVVGIVFFGLLDITYNDLVTLFGESAEHYERYDDAFEFFFRDTAIDKYSIKCFILDNDKQKTNWQNKNLGNIAIHFY